MFSLWLDDERPAPDGFHHVFTAEDAIRFLDENDVELVSLDHDLGDKDHNPEWTGYTVLLHIEKKVFTDESYIPPEIRIHTQNSSARIKMEACARGIRQKVEAR